MIFISSSCVKNEFIWQSIEQIASYGFKNIELSGGTNRSANMIDKIIDLKEKYSLNYRCHNYFPPPNNHFVMNLASSSDKIYCQTLELIDESISLSKIMGCEVYGFHAGFLTDISIEEIGKSVQGKTLTNRDETIETFIKRFKELHQKNKIKLYVENNVVSLNNYVNFDYNNPFLLTTSEDLKLFKEVDGMNIIFDIGHLYVSCQTLSKNFNDEFKSFNEISDYIHISDNNGKSDQNKALKEGSDIYNALLEADLNEKCFTLEINNDIEGLHNSYKIIEELA